jgi:bacterioferritin
MRGDATVIQHLNAALKNELTAINQYFLHARMLKHWGVTKLGDYEYKQSIDEMKDADELIERILYLEGLPNLQRLGTVRVGETAKEKLELALAVESEAIERLNTGIASCVAAGDNGSRELLEKILLGEEEHADWLETQLDLVAKLGDTLYLSQQIGS